MISSALRPYGCLPRSNDIYIFFLFHERAHLDFPWFRFGGFGISRKGRCFWCGWPSVAFLLFDFLVYPRTPRCLHCASRRFPFRDSIWHCNYQPTQLLIFSFVDLGGQIPLRSMLIFSIFFFANMYQLELGGRFIYFHGGKGVGGWLGMHITKDIWLGFLFGVFLSFLPPLVVPASDEHKGTSISTRTKHKAHRNRNTNTEMRSSSLLKRNQGVKRKM